VYGLSDALPSLDSAAQLLDVLQCVVQPLPADAPERAQLSDLALSLLQVRFLLGCLCVAMSLTLPRGRCHGLRPS
jgi:hypothetical protein